MEKCHVFMWMDMISYIGGTGRIGEVIDQLNGQLDPTRQDGVLIIIGGQTFFSVYREWWSKWAQLLCRWEGGGLWKFSSACFCILTEMGNEVSTD
jgi:hypothetical protein